MNEIQIRNFFPTYQGPQVSELKQDLLVLAATDRKTQGFFVEFGAMDGIAGSNTVVLEKHYNWQGIIAEPNRTYREILPQNRTCRIDYRAVTGQTGKRLEFKEVNTQPGLSTLVEHMMSDHHGTTRSNNPGDVYVVDTVSLVDLLEQHQAPRHIDYISIDTEGAEVDVLENFDFSKYDIDIWTVEHNYQTQSRQRILEIMEFHGYKRLLQDMSAYDDWYIKSSIID